LKPGPKMSGLRKESGAEGKGVGKDQGVPGKIPDVDELSKRFAALKK